MQRNGLLNMYNSSIHGDPTSDSQEAKDAKLEQADFSDATLCKSAESYGLKNFVHRNYEDIVRGILGGGGGFVGILFA